MPTREADAFDGEFLDDDIPDGPPLDLGAEDEAAPASVKAGAAAIRSFWKHAPTGPGVYRMIGADDAVLYVGKAKSVRKRIASYMRPSGHTNRIARMIALTQTMVFVSTATETEALLLETNLIKQLKPRFNVLMRDDKSFPYILLTADHSAPQIIKHRGARSRKGDYFGPFASVWAVNRTLNALERAFLLRSCSDSYYENRTRPCLLHQIKRCSAPCTGEIAPAEYAVLVKEAKDFLTGKSRAVRDLLAGEMAAASADLAFERAARLRDRIAALSAIQGEQGVNPKTTEEADVFAVVEQAGQFCVEAVFFRTYQNWGNRGYFPKADRSMAPAEVLESFLAQFYAERPPPRLVLLSHDFEDRALLEMALAERHGLKTEIAVPQRGEKRDLVDHATNNARQTLGRTLAETASQEKLLAALAAAFGLERRLRRVEVYDNSHIMGTNAVGGMVVAGTAGFMKMHYRTFNIKGDDLTPGDDFGMMREVLRRRFARLNKDAPASAPAQRGRGTMPSMVEGAPNASISGEDGPEDMSERAAVSPAPPPPPSVVPLPRFVEEDQTSRIVAPPTTMRERRAALDEAPRVASTSAQRGRGTMRSMVEGAPDASISSDDAGGRSSGDIAVSPAPPPPPSVVLLPRFAEEDVAENDVFPARPDLILIDGGLGQYNATRQILDELGVTDVAVAGIAKGRDREAGRELFYVDGREPFRMAPRDPALYFVQRLRDEAHRFAIGTHRARRKKDFTKSPLDEISGIGPARKRALLHAFGTAKALSRAALGDLEKVPGINAGTAKLVYDHFHERG